MAARNIAAFGIYTDQVSAGEAADALTRVGFRSTDSSILVPDNIGSKDLAHEKRTKAPEGAAFGAFVGIVIGACLGWLVSRGDFATVPWLAQFTAVGVLGAVLSGAGAGSVLGLVIGALIGSATPEYEAIRYEGRTRRGGVLLSVHCDNTDWKKRAEDTLRETGAKHIGARREARADFGASEKPLPRTRATAVLEHRQRIREESDLLDSRENLEDTEPIRPVDSHRI